MTKPAYYLPRVWEQDYPAFCGLMGRQIPPTYAAWLEFLAQRRHEASASHEVMEIEVNPGEFARFCRLTEQKYDQATLARFIADKAEGHLYE